MGELPLLALVALLDHLPLGDAVRYRRVSKQWRHLIDHSVNKQELVLFVEAEPHADWWEYNGEPINLANSVRANFGAFQSRSFFALFKGSVRRLFLSFNHLAFSQVLTDNLANFGSSLEHLHIDFQSNNSANHKIEKFNLTLRNLKTFYFARTLFDFGSSKFQFSLDCDRLTHLYANDRLEVENDSNRFLLVKMTPNLRVLFVTEIIFQTDLKFPNLEILGCSYPKPTTELFASRFPNLKQFHFTGALRFIDSTRNEIRSLLRKIEKEKSTLDVFWLGLQFTLENTDRLLNALEKHSDQGFTSKTLRYFKEIFFKELPKRKSKKIRTTRESAGVKTVDILHFKPTRHMDAPVHYSDPFADQLGGLDGELIEKLAKCWHSVRIDDFKRPLDVAKLSGVFRFVNKLTVSRVLEPSEFEALPAIFLNLQMFDLTTSSSELVDFSFVSQFKNLYKLSTMLTPSPACLDRLISDCAHLYQVSLGSGKKQLSVRIRDRIYWRTERRFLLILYQPEAMFCFKSKESLLEFLELNQYLTSE